MDLVERSQWIAEQLLAEQLPTRWRHVRAVSAKAERISHILDAEGDRVALVAAAWLHDVGYSRSLALTGFHPLDGGRWLHANGFEARIASLVAHHSYALVEADERGLAAELGREFAREDSFVADALCYCDMTTGPDGQSLDVFDRLAEARGRYGPGEVVTRFLVRAQDEIVAAVRRTEKLLADAGLG